MGALHRLDDVTLAVADGVTLTPFRLADAPAVEAAVADPEIRRWLPLPDPYPPELAEAWCTHAAEEVRLSGRGLVRALRWYDDCVGCVDAKRIDWSAQVAEIGYWAAPHVRGKGLTSAAVTAFATWLLTIAGFERVELRIATGNHASRRVAVKAAFQFEGVARNAGYTDRGRVDLAVYSAIAGELTGQV
jgi:RimJ/RimL family protein N-acetyltransferase